jgi:hydrogenase expression/formation protein HypC
MCIAIPGKITCIDGQKAKVDFNGNLINVNVGLINPKVGDYVLVHAGCAIEKLDKDRAEELTELFRDLEEMTR